MVKDPVLSKHSCSGIGNDMRVARFVFSQLVALHLKNPQLHPQSNLLSD
jgi:hypothetical protein